MACVNCGHEPSKEHGRCSNCGFCPCCKQRGVYDPVDRVPSTNFGLDQIVISDWPGTFLNKAQA